MASCDAFSKSSVDAFAISFPFSVIISARKSPELSLVRRISLPFVAPGFIPTDVQKQFSENVQRRTFILGFLGQLEGYTDTISTAHGEDIYSLMQLAVPSALFPNKNRFFSEEGLADDLFGANYTDEANSLLTAGVIDFGIWGIFLYPLAAVIIVRGFFEIIAESMPLFASCFVILSSFSILLEPEVTATSYFLIIRSGLLFGSVAWVVMSLPEFRIKNVGM